MKTIPVAALRQNPTHALDEVERGETYVVTRHGREVARLVPPAQSATVTPQQFLALVRATPLSGEWADELKETATDFDGDDPWSPAP